jgi:hypothetical protein
LTPKDPLAFANRQPVCIPPPGYNIPALFYARLPTSQQVVLQKNVSIPKFVKTLNEKQRSQTKGMKFFGNMTRMYEDGWKRGI